MFHGPFVFFLMIAIVIIALAIIIVKIKKEEKAKKIALARSKADSLRTLGGIHNAEMLDATAYLDGFRILPKGLFGFDPKGFFDGISFVTTTINGHVVNVRFGDYEYHIVDGDGGSDSYTQTVFLAELADFEFESLYTRPPRLIELPWRKPKPLDEVISDPDVREIVKRNKWEVETKGSRCLIYKCRYHHHPDQYGSVLEDFFRVVAHLIIGQKMGQASKVVKVKD